jgi:methylisocitrate lyase
MAVPGVFNAFTARLAENAGFPALYISGAGLSACRAVPDIGLLTMTDVVTETRLIIQMVKVPVVVDADTGFGDIHQVCRTVQELESVGAAGLQIEDQVLAKRCGHLPGKELIDTQTMCQKVTAAVEARRDHNFLVIVRTDARAVEGLEGAIERGKAYVAAGADAIFPEALESGAEFQQFANALNHLPTFLVANMTEWGKTPFLLVKEFSQLGFHMVLFPMTVFRIMARSVEETLRELNEKGTQQDLIGRMQTRKELYDVLRYEEYTQFDSRVRGRQVDHGDGVA